MKKRIFRKDFSGVPVYSIQLSNKKQDGTYDNAFMPVKFKKGIEIENKTDVDIKEWFPTFYRNKDNEPVIQLMITEYEIEKEKDAFEEFGEEVELKDEDLPF